MTETVDIKTIHPELEPVFEAPKQFSYFGIGTRLFGKRDFNNQSRSHVATLCFTLFFVPIFPLAAYRVAQHGSDRYVLGKVPVSAFAKKAGVAAVSALLLTGVTTAIMAYLDSPSYQARNKLSQAEDSINAGHYAAAAQLYKSVFDGAPAEFSNQAKESMKRLLSHERIGAIPDSELAETIKTIRSIPSSHLRLNDQQLLADTKARLTAIQQTAPTEAHQLYHSIADLAADDIAFQQMDEPLLRAVLGQNPEQVDAVVELAQLLVTRGDHAAALAILQPVEAKLGSSDGARILGQAYVAEGDFQRAYPLLSAYMADRLKALNSAEKHYFDLQKNLWDAEFDKLNKGKGPQSFYSRYDKTPEAERQALVNEYVANQVRGNKKLAVALEAYRDKAKVVPVALDYGIVLLRRAETMTDAAARDAELKHAESTFLAINGVVGDSDDYRLYLGQVYYWLGKHEDGHKQFDELLNKYKRSQQALLSVANILRNIGMNAEATELAKESYDAASDKVNKYAAAQLLALLAQTQKDRLFWLERADPTAPSVVMDLTSEKGYAAERDGNGKKAAEFYREAIKQASVLPASAATYNNTALIYLALHRVSGEQRALAQGIELMEKAVELSPSDSILLGNVASYLMTNGLREIFAGKVDFALLQTDPSLDDLGFLYADQRGYEQYQASVGSNPLIKRAADYLKKIVLLAPKEARNYFSLYQLASFTKDTELMSYINGKLEQNAVDLVAIRKQYDDYIQHADQAETEKSLRQQIAFYRALNQQAQMSAMTRAVAQSKLAELLLRQVQDGALASADEAVQLLESAQKLQPSSALSSQLVTALMTQASLAVARQSVGYRQQRERAGRNLTDESLAALALCKNEADAKLLQEHASSQRAFDIVVHDMQLFPKATGLTDWALVVHQRPETAERIANNVRVAPESKLADAIARKLYAYSTHAAVGSYLYNKLNGEVLSADKVLAEYAQQQTYLPSQLL
ncbi:hypothetical protein HPT27_07025 [Permianibacter sp. IMCC34836]|uniref:tetratricopeptide repeat protein n=1 Tax=Permianibacter fluminis TaxID=2738515 RepID=UPI00155643E5|nr:hypothetical protein [Permianibacter fluminis]NQD36774.1 hypothetical protein [Permianibacter fluminis]